MLGAGAIAVVVMQVGGGSHTVACMPTGAGAIVVIVVVIVTGVGGGSHTIACMHTGTGVITVIAIYAATGLKPHRTGPCQSTIVVATSCNWSKTDKRLVITSSDQFTLPEIYF